MVSPYLVDIFGKSQRSHNGPIPWNVWDVGILPPNFKRECNKFCKKLLSRP